LLSWQIEEKAIKVAKAFSMQSNVRSTEELRCIECDYPVLVPDVSTRHFSIAVGEDHF
jgi:hypothetical protein